MTRILVTGGSSGIGAAIVKTMALEGCDVSFTYNKTVDALDHISKDLPPDAQARLTSYKCDLANEDEVSALANTLMLQAEPFDGIVHAAGVIYDAPASMLNMDRAKQTMQVNFWSLVGLLNVLLQPMMRARKGSVVVIGSVVAQSGSRGNSIYAASKAALEGYVRCLVDEAGRRQVTVNIVAPGYIDTPMIAQLKEQPGYKAQMEGRRPRVPQARTGEPQEIADLVAFLLSDKARYINGATLTIDGGMTATVGF